MGDASRILKDDNLLCDAIYHLRTFPMYRVKPNTPEWELKMYINSMSYEACRIISSIWLGKGEQKWRKDSKEWEICQHEKLYSLDKLYNNALLKINRLRFKMWYFKKLKYSV